MQHFNMLGCIKMTLTAKYGNIDLNIEIICEFV